MESTQQQGVDRNGLSFTMRDEIKKYNARTEIYIQPDTDELKSDLQTRGDFPEKKISCISRGLVFILVVLIFISGLVLLIYYKRESSPDGQRGSVIPTEEEKEEDTRPSEKYICPDVTVNLRGIISFKCSLRSANVSKQDLGYVSVTPPLYMNKGTPFNITVSEVLNTSWSGQFDVENNSYVLHVRGPEATCSSGGVYQLQFRNRYHETTAQTTVNIGVKSQVSRVNVSLSQDKDNNNTAFTLGCSTNSGCEQSFVDFFAEINKEEQYLRGVNFTCTISYNDYDGYGVSCFGVIPDYLMSQFEKITCRPRSSLLDDLDDKELEELESEIELPECDLTKHCGYECKNDGDYYVVSMERCDIFHRCYQKQVFTSYCAPGTFFDPHNSFCACRHTSELAWCQQNGALKPGSDVSELYSCT